MKRIIVLLFIFVTTVSLLFAESFWCIDSTHNINTEKKSDGSYRYDAYRYNYSTVFDLNKYYNYSNRTTPQIGDYNQTDGLDSVKAIGTVGVEGCEHSIIYEIDTNGGVFVSQSDPSKYRKYYVVNVPDYSREGSTSRSYYYMSSSGSSAAALSTKDNGTNSMSFTAPKTDGSSTYIYVGQQSWWGGSVTYTNTSVDVASVGLDLFLCMDKLSPEDKTHLSSNNDYIATITVSWHCAESGCNDPNHNGVFNMLVRGYYENETGGTDDSFWFLVSPASDTTTLDLKKIIQNYTAPKTIATISVATTTVERNYTYKNGNQTVTVQNYDWRDRIYAFLSASPDYTVSDQNGFVLTKMSNHSITIPYTLTVSNTTYGSGILTNPITYDGKAKFISGNHTYCLDLKDYSKEATNFYNYSIDRFGTEYYAINYTGQVDLQISNFTIPGSTNDIVSVMNDPLLNNIDYTKYIGKYESNIYYHIVFDDSGL